MKIATICPTKNRPEMLRDMVKSFKKTKACSNWLYIVADTDDKNDYESEYKNVLRFEPHSLTMQINRCYERIKYDFDYFHVTNDDVVYITSGWDRILTDAIEGHGLSFGNDGYFGDKLATFNMVQRDLPHVLGWLQCPSVSSLYADNIWTDIGHALGRIWYCPEVQLLHRHWTVGLRPKESSWDARMERDRAAYQNWKLNEKDKQVQAIRNYLKCQTKI